MLRYIRIGRDAMDPSSKRKFYDGVDQVSHGGHWKRSRRNGTRNSEVQNHRNVTIFGGRQSGHYVWRDRNHGRGRGLRGGNGNNTNPPTKTGRKCGAVV